MYRLLPLLTLCVTGAMSSATASAADLVWHWEDRFSPAEKRKLQAWVTETTEAVEQLVAPLPFDIHIHFHRTSSRSPVPWANTIRSRRQGVNFHVNPSASAADLRDDWTAYHELSHLLIPYLGRRHSWFAEGFASYMQYQVMRSHGVISTDEMEQKYQQKIGRAERRYRMDDMPFVEAAPKLRAQRQYPTMYWGGAVYFLRIDQALKDNGTSIPEVLREFVDCCRHSTRGLNNLVAELDRIAGSDAFRTELDKVRTLPGFPDDTPVWTSD